MSETHDLYVMNVGKQSAVLEKILQFWERRDEIPEDLINSYIYLSCEIERFRARSFIAGYERDIISSQEGEKA